MDYGSGNTFGYSYGWSTAAPTAPQVKPEQQHQHHMYGGHEQKMQSTHTQNLMASQKPVGYWLPPSNKTAPTTATNSYGYGSSGVGGGMRPGGGSSFPKKSNWAEKKRTTLKKPFDPSGKTPAMLLHELFKSVLERYDEVEPAPHKKSYRCVVIIEGKEYSADASSKKIAKQKASEAAIRALRPDIKVTPFDELKPANQENAAVVKAEHGPPKKKPKMSASVDVPVNLNLVPAPQRKVKVPALESALSLIDLLRKLSLEREGMNPQMEYEDITEGELPPNKIHKRRFRFTLSFPEQGKKFVKEGFGKNSPKELALRDALKELFNVADNDIQRIVKKSLIPKIESLGPIQILYHMAALFSREIVFSVVDGEQKSLSAGHIAPTYIATCTVKDPEQQIPDFSCTGEKERSKVEARESAAKIAIKEAFDLDVDNLPKAAPTPVPAVQKLSLLLTKQGRGKNLNAKFEELPAETDPSGVGSIFRCKCVVGEKEFIGMGRSKKLAKNQAAHAALKGIFNFDYVEELNNDPEPKPTASRLCIDIAEYAKREYFNMCSYYAVRPSTEMAAFFLVNEKNEKRLISIGSSQQTIIDGRNVIEGEGQTLLHVQSIVLARRSMIRYFITELANLGDDGCIFVKDDDGSINLKKTLRLVLYSTFAPDVRYSGLEATEPSLTIYGGHGGLERSPSDQQSLEKAASSGYLRVHSVADKIFKWTHLGVQGGLLSTMISPIVISSVFFGSVGPAEDISLRHAFYQRLGNVKADVTVETNKISIRPVSSVAHLWTRDMEHVEVLNLDTGRTNKGSPSRLAKAEMFQAFLKIRPDLATKSYLEAKEQAVNYQTMKGMFYAKIAENGLGAWQRKPSKINDFKLACASD